MTEDTTEQEGKDPNLMEKRSLNCESSEKEWNGIGSVLKGKHLGGLNKLTIPDADNPGQRKECHLRSEIEEN